MCNGMCRGGAEAGRRALACMQLFAEYLAQDGDGQGPILVCLALAASLLQGTAQHGIDHGLIANALRLRLGAKVLDDVIVKGKTAPVRVYTPCDDAQVRQLSQAALDALQAHDAQQAQASLDTLLLRLPGDLAALRLQERLTHAAGGGWPGAVALDKL